MITRTRGFFKCCNSVTCLVIAFVFILTPAFAQGPAVGSGQSIQDAVSAVLGKTGNLADKLSALCQDSACQESPAGKMFQNKVKQTKAAQDRAVKANNRASAADYNKINRRKGKNKQDD